MNEDFEILDEGEPDTSDLPEVGEDFFKNAVRGKYAGCRILLPRMVQLAADVADVFRDDAEVNEALRMLIRLSHKVEEKRAGGSIAGEAADPATAADSDPAKAAA